MFFVLEIMEHSTWTNETAANEFVHNVYGWKFNFNFPNNDCGDDDIQTNQSYANS